MRYLIAPMLAVALAAPAHAQPTADEYRSDAFDLVQKIEEGYAYRDRFDDGTIPFTPALRAEAERVDDRRSLLLFAERMLLALRDHHAITGSSLPDSWAIVPSYADVWIVYREGTYMVDAVRENSPAADADVTAGMLLTRVGEQDTHSAVIAFWDDLGLDNPDGEALAFAARVLAAGRRDRDRHLAFRGEGGEIDAQLPSLYAGEAEQMPPLMLDIREDLATIRFNNSLGDSATIAAFDAAMADAAASPRLVLDLTDTPGGGNTVIARAIMGWFASEPAPYQIHSLPAEERQTGIARQWTEYVLPREGMHYDGEVSVRVGRWTGSMGEGLAIGMQALGARLEGHAMAGLLGAIYDISLDTGLLIKLPVERLRSVDGVPREDIAIGAD